MDVARLVSLGVFDPESDTAEDDLALLQQVIDLGATDAELVEAASTGTLGVLALELAIRSPGERLDFEEAARRAGVDPAHAARYWRAAGFVDPEAAPPRCAPEDAEVMRLMAFAESLFGLDATLAMARAMGTFTARLAETIVDAFRTEFELPQQAAGMSYSEIVRMYSTVTTETLPQLGDTVSAMFRRHLMTVAAGSWTVDEEAATTRRDLVVGFVDLVGYTAHTGTMSPRRLASLVTRLEERVSDQAARFHTRVVKLIGDGAMFVSERAPDAGALALGLVEEFAEDENALPLRAGLAFGSVVGVHGDYFGPVVNTAARLLAVASPSEVVVDESLVGLVGEELVLEPLPPQTLKGLPTPSELFRLRRA